MTKVETHHFSVTMTCDGCANAVKKVLNDLNKNADGEVIENVDINLNENKVSVKSRLTSTELKTILERTGKSVQIL